jgi:hypothetical protein
VHKIAFSPGEWKYKESPAPIDNPIGEGRDAKMMFRETALKKGFEKKKKLMGMNERKETPSNSSSNTGEHSKFSFSLYSQFFCCC